MEFEYDPERLIEEVKKRPGIWDFEDIEYKTKNIRRKLWNEVVKELLADTSNVSKSELRELELQLQKKWKSIRDCFHKCVTNPNPKRKQPYVYFKQLSFLLKNQEMPKPEAVEGSSDSDDQGRRSRRRVWKTKKKLRLVKEESEDEIGFDNQADADYSNDGVQEPVPVKLARKTEGEFMFANVDVVPKGEAEDPEKLFLLSLLPHLKSIPEELRLNVKMELMQVLRNSSFTTIRSHTVI